jgi:hypothetical protein
MWKQSSANTLLWEKQHHHLLTVHDQRCGDLRTDETADY